MAPKKLNKVKIQEAIVNSFNTTTSKSNPASIASVATSIGQCFTITNVGGMIPKPRAGKSPENVLSLTVKDVGTSAEHYVYLTRQHLVKLHLALSELGFSVEEDDVIEHYQNLTGLSMRVVELHPYNGYTFPELIWSATPPVTASTSSPQAPGLKKKKLVNTAPGNVTKKQRKTPPVKPTQPVFNIEEEEGELEDQETDDEEESDDGLIF